MAGRKRHLLALIFSMIFAGLIGYNMRLIGAEIPIVSVLFSRLFLGVIVVALIIPFIDKNTFKVRLKNIIHFALVGALMAGTFGFYLWALSLAPVANVTLITSTSVIFTAIFSYFFLKEKVTKHLIISAAIAAIGLWIMNTFMGGFLFGSIVALIQAGFFGGLIAATRFEEKHESVGAVFWFLLFAALFSFPLALWKGFGEIGNHVQEILIIGIFGTGLAYALFVYGIRKVKANVAAVVTLIFLPLFSIIFAAIFIGEIPGTRTVVGGVVLLIAGAYLLLRKEIKNWGIFPA